jgi:hypothetical protein
MSHQEIDYSLSNPSNYKATFQADRKDVQAKFIDLIIDYLDHIKTKSIFVKVRGLETMFHVFYTVLSYTKNLLVSSLNARKAFYLYSEFTEQIAEDANLVLQLSSREAVLYVYKKTLYDLSNEHVKENKQNLDIIFQDVLLLKTLAESFIEKTSTQEMRKMFVKLCQCNFGKEEQMLLFSLVGQEKLHENFLLILKKIVKAKQQNINIDLQNIICLT